VVWACNGNLQITYQLSLPLEMTFRHKHRRGMFFFMTVEKNRVLEFQ